MLCPTPTVSALARSQPLAADFVLAVGEFRGHSNFLILEPTQGASHSSPEDEVSQMECIGYT
jgi:hypothetical protein